MESNITCVLQGEEGLIHFQWLDRTNNVIEDVSWICLTFSITSLYIMLPICICMCVQPHLYASFNSYICIFDPLCIGVLHQTTLICNYKIVLGFSRGIAWHPVVFTRFSSKIIFFILYVALVCICAHIY